MKRFTPLPQSFSLVCLAMGSLGFFSLAALPVALELSVECTYPVGESTSAGLMFLAGQLFGLIITFSMNALVGPKPGPLEIIAQPDMTNACWFVSGGALFSAIIMLFFKTEYHRLKIDQVLLSSSPLM